MSKSVWSMGRQNVQGFKAQGIRALRAIAHSVGLGALLAGMGCAAKSPDVPPRALQIQQKWQLQPGSVVAGRLISGGLGDISVELDGATVYAPFDGKVQPFEHDCLIYSTSEVPAYAFRLCGLEQVELGDLRQGEAIGSGDLLQFAALRKQPDGQWAMVEPSSIMLERLLSRP